jgi:hypothetical protein
LEGSNLAKTLRNGTRRGEGGNWEYSLSISC